MKKILTSLALFASLLYLLALSGCSKGSEPLTETQRVQELLTASKWQLRTVTVDDTDQTVIYNGLIITFTPTGYTTTSGKEIWPASDTWNFTDDTAKSFKRGDGLEVAITEITATSLILELSWSKDTFVVGRIASIKGKHNFKFKK